MSGVTDEHAAVQQGPHSEGSGSRRRRSHFPAAWRAGGGQLSSPAARTPPPSRCPSSKSDKTTDVRRLDGSPFREPADRICDVASLLVADSWTRTRPRPVTTDRAPGYKTHDRCASPRNLTRPRGAIRLAAKPWRGVTEGPCDPGNRPAPRPPTVFMRGTSSDPLRRRSLLAGNRSW